MRLFVVEDQVARIVAEGVEFTDGTVAIRYRGRGEVGTSLYASLTAATVARLSGDRSLRWLLDEVGAARAREGEAIRRLRVAVADQVACGFVTPAALAAREWLEGMAA